MKRISHGREPTGSRGQQALAVFAKLFDDRRPRHRPRLDIVTGLACHETANDADEHGAVAHVGVDRPPESPLAITGPLNLNQPLPIRVTDPQASPVVKPVRHTGMPTSGITVSSRSSRWPLARTSLTGSPSSIEMAS